MQINIFSKLHKFASILFWIIITVSNSVANAAMEVNFQEPATKIAQEQYDLHLAILVIITLIGVGVFGVMIYSIFAHRKSKGHQAANFHHNTTVEIIWTVIPFIIIVAMALPSTKVILDIKDSSNPDMTIKIVGYQWKWSYDYLDENIFFYSTMSTPPEQVGSLFYGEYGATTPISEMNENYLLEVDNPMVVPVGKKIRLLLTAADVLHAWAVPAFGVKQDTIPGIVREAWFQADREGTFRGQCSELCGKNHGFMPIVVEVVSEAEYQEWVVAQGGGRALEDQPVAVGDVVPATPVADLNIPAEWTFDAVMEFGEEAYVTNCAACHQTNGAGLEPSFPSLIGSALTTGPASDHIDIVLNGKEGTTMASFAYLSDAEIAAIIHYERNSWGNNTGDLVTPEDVASRR